MLNYSKIFSYNGISSRGIKSCYYGLINWGEFYMLKLDSQGGFTLLELVVIVAITVILVALLLFNLNSGT